MALKLSIPKPELLRDKPQLYCIAAIFFIFVNGPFGGVTADLFLALSGFIAISYYRKLLFLLSRYWLFLIFPLTCLLSAAWSDDRGLTARYSIEMLLTFISALLISRFVAPWNIVRTIFVAASILILLSMLRVPLQMSQRIALKGIYESKNAMANVSHLSYMASVAIMFGERKNFLLRLSGLVMSMLALFTMVLANSAGASVALAVSLSVFLAGSLYSILPRRFRGLALLTVLLFAVMIAIAYPFILKTWAEFQQDVLHKDTTLTGRTYLWEFAGRLIRERPWIGHGAGSFWREGNLDAEGLWFKYDIPWRHGFNFHNTFIEIAVGEGYLGVAVFVALIVVVGMRLLLGYARYPTRTKLFMISYLAAWYVRLPTELLVGPFEPENLLLVVAGVFAMDRSAVKKPIKKYMKWAADRARYRAAGLIAARTTPPMAAKPG